MIPEAAYAMLACTRIGAIHSVVFGGFSAESIKDRALDCGATLIITADGSYRRGAVVPLKANVDAALAGGEHEDLARIGTRGVEAGQKEPRRDTRALGVEERCGLDPVPHEHGAEVRDPLVARQLGEWSCRLVLTYSDFDAPVRIDLADPLITREFVRTFVLPGVAAMSHFQSAPTSGPATATGSAPVAELATATSLVATSSHNVLTQQPALRPEPALVNPEE